MFPLRENRSGARRPRETNLATTTSWGRARERPYAVATTAGACALWLSHHGRERLIRRYGASNLTAVFREILTGHGFERAERLERREVRSRNPPGRSPARSTPPRSCAGCGSHAKGTAGSPKRRGRARAREGIFSRRRQGPPRPSSFEPPRCAARGAPCLTRTPRRRAGFSRRHGSRAPLLPAPVRSTGQARAHRELLASSRAFRDLTSRIIPHSFGSVHFCSKKYYALQHEEARRA